MATERAQVGDAPQHRVIVRRRRHGRSDGRFYEWLNRGKDKIPCVDGAF